MTDTHSSPANADILTILRNYIPGENDDCVAQRIAEAADEIERLRDMCINREEFIANHNLWREFSQYLSEPHEQPRIRAQCVPFPDPKTVEACAAVIEDFPATILEIWERPNGPPGNGYRSVTRKDLAAAVRSIQPVGSALTSPECGNTPEGK